MMLDDNIVELLDVCKGILILDFLETIITLLV